MRREWLLICLFVGVLAYTFGVNSGPAAAQQAFLPRAFQPGSKLTLNNDRSTTYVVLSQQGAWVEVRPESEGQGAKSDGQNAKEMWIYAPSGTLWLKVK